MPADEAIHGVRAQRPRERTGPRHAAPKKPLFTKIQVPAGRAIAIASMPTALLMGLSLAPTLAQADDQPSSRNLTIDEYEDCAEALDGTDADKDTSASPSPSPSDSASDATSDGKDDSSADSSDPADPSAEPEPSASKPADSGSTSNSSASNSSGGTSSGSSDSDSEPAPSATATKEPSSADTGETAAPTPSASESGGNVLEDIGNALKDIFTPGDETSASASASPSPSVSPSATESASDTAGDTADKATDAAKDTTDTAEKSEKAIESATDSAAKAVKGAEDAQEKAAEEAEEAAESASPSASASASASPSPSASESADAENCPAATDEAGGVEKIVALPDEPWHLEASSLTLKGADYKGVVKVKTANGTVKEVLKYVISGGTDIGDLHQIVNDSQSGKTYHVQAAKGSTSTITDGDTVMYTEKISGNLFGLIPVTFSPENPPPLNIPLIHFTDAKVTQAGQFGGTLHVPGLHQFATD